MTLFLTGLVLGIISSGHCLGMCGPIAFTLGSCQLPPQSPALKRVRLFCLIGLGKALTYGWIGLMFGWFGRLLTDWSRWLGFAQALPWIAGFLFIFAGLGIAGWIPRFEMTWQRLESFMLKSFSPFFNSRQSSLNLFAMGLIWGLIPCPMVLAPALAAAVSGSVHGSEGAARGFLMMFGFGLGTIPALYLSAWAGQWLKKIKHWSPVIVGFILVLLGAAIIFYSFLPANHTHHEHHAHSV